MQLSTEQMFSHIVEMQCELNEKTVPDWLSKKLDWDTAILVEVAEAIDSTDWKWWKRTETDLANLKVEAIDLLHFLVAKMVESISKALPIHDAIEYTADELHCAHMDAVERSSMAGIVESLKYIAKATLNGKPCQSLFWLMVLFNRLEMDAEAIYKAYITKNLLNHYRQERGYNDPNGDYLKIINGQEDNIVFAACIDNVIKIKSEKPLTLEQIKNHAFISMDSVVFDAINL